MVVVGSLPAFTFMVLTAGAGAGAGAGCSGAAKREVMGRANAQIVRIAEATMRYAAATMRYAEATIAPKNHTMPKRSKRLGSAAT
jgi:hypothetical protein